MKKQNNKGAAMLTVLIAITFIAVLATSLMYMAYMNYKTKALRFASSNNFYSDEFALDEVAASLQQLAADQTSINAAKEAIRNTVSGSTATLGVYCPAAVQDLIEVTTGVSTNNLLITVSSNDPVYVETDKSITLKNLQIICEDKNLGSYSSITTDLQLSFASTLGGDFDVNDFSVISKSMINTTTKSGSTIFTGCIYVKKPSGSTVSFQASAGRSVTILSPKAVFDGDFIVEDGSAVFIGGNVNVNGDLCIGSGSTVIVAGKLNLSGKVRGHDGHFGTLKTEAGIATYDGSNDVADVSGLSENIKTDVDSIKTSLDALPESMAEALFAKHMYILPGENGNPAPVDLGGYNPSYTLPIEFICRDAWHSDSDIAKAYTNYSNPDFTGSGDGDAKNPKYYWNNIGLQDQTDNGFNYCLALNCKDLNVKYDHYNTTILTLGNLNYNENGTTLMTNMDDEYYQACKENFLYYDKQVGTTTVKTLTGGATTGTDWNQFVDMITDPNGQGTADYKVIQYNAVTGAIIDNDLTISEREALDPEDISVDGETRYLIWNDNPSGGIKKFEKQYVPAGYLLAPDTKSIIAKYFALGESADDPTNTVVAYVNWSKD